MLHIQRDDRAGDDFNYQRPSIGATSCPRHSRETTPPRDLLTRCQSVYFIASRRVLLHDADVDVHQASSESFLQPSLLEGERAPARAGPPSSVGFLASRSLPRFILALRTHQHTHIQYTYTLHVAHCAHHVLVLASSASLSATRRARHAGYTEEHVLALSSRNFLLLSHACMYVVRACRAVQSPREQARIRISELARSSACMTRKERESRYPSQRPRASIMIHCQVYDHSDFPIPYNRVLASLIAHGNEVKTSFRSRP